jgi:teichuronic acid exporter
VIDNLKSRTLKAAVWNLFGTTVSSLFQFGVGVILARILSPSEFGLLGMVLVFVAIGSVFSEGGFGFALIHNKNATRLQETSVLIWNILIAVGVYFALWFLSPAISSFYQQPVLEGVLRLLAIRVLIGAAGIVQRSYLMRTLNFRTLTWVNIAAAIVGGSTGIVLALQGYGVWALVWQALANSTATTVFLWVLSSWRPVWGFCWLAIRQMGSYGGKMVISGLVSTTFENINNILIGRFYAPADLGLFTRAQNLTAFTSVSISNALSSVLLPTLVQANDDRDGMCRAFQRAMQGMVALISPVIVLLFVLAEPVFILLFTEKWVPAVPFFRMLCIPAILYPAHLINLNVLLALGRPGLYLKIEIIKRGVSLALSLAAIPHGVFALTGAMVAGSFLALPVNIWYPSKMAGLGLRRQLAWVWEALYPSLVAGICSFAATHFYSATDFWKCVAGCTAFAATLLVLATMTKNGIYRYVFTSIFYRLKAVAI